MKRKHNPFPGTSVMKDRHGKRRFRLRLTTKGGTIDAYLPGPYGGPAFRAAYESAKESIRPNKRRTAIKPGTVSFVIESYLGSSAFGDLSDGTKKQKRTRLDWIRAAIGEASYANIQPHQIESLMARKGGATAGNRLKKDLSQLYAYAKKRFAYAGLNPASMADSRKVKKGGHHTWTDSEIERFLSYWPSGSKARLVLVVLLCTGTARQDAAKLTRANIKKGRVEYRRGKTGNLVDLPILEQLAVELDHVPYDQFVLIGHGKEGRAYGPQALTNLMSKWVKEAGLPDCCTAHGLRKAGARRLAEAGATEFEVMSFLGHSTAKEASRYTAAADRARMADSELARLSNLPSRLDKTGPQAIDSKKEK